MHALRSLVLAAAACLMALPASARAQAGPHPYPLRERDWPGAGVVRMFDWMPVKRQMFWEERRIKQGSIVFAGDSLTEGWETLAEDFKPLPVANRGIGGEVSRGLLFRFNEDVLALQPRAIVLLIGTNDLTARQPAAITLANVRAMLTMWRMADGAAPLFLCTVPPSANPDAPVDARELTALNAGLRGLVKDYPNLFIVDLFAAMATAQGKPAPLYFSPDLLHPSPAGHARWKQVMIPVMREAGVLLHE